MIGEILTTIVAASSTQIAEEVYKVVVEYLKKKGRKISDSATENEIKNALDAIEAAESVDVKIAEAQSVFGDAIARLASFRHERERQAKNSYNLAWVVLGAGSAIILVGIALTVVGHSVVPGTITSAVGAITSLCSGAIFRFANDANNRLDEASTNLYKIESARVALEVVQKLKNEEEKDAAIKDIASSLGHSRAKRPSGRKNPTSGQRPKKTATQTPAEGA
jgi:ABC-type multidrug transport system fused ATPase/permease subunit